MAKRTSLELDISTAIAFTTETSQALRLATASAAKIANALERQGLVIPEEHLNDRKLLKRTALRLSWGWHKGNVVNKQKKQDYGAAQHCDDDMANVLAYSVRTVNPDTNESYLDMAKLRDIAKQNAISLDRWMHLNVGQIRMNFGNVLRGRVEAGVQVIVGDRIWNEGSTLAPKELKAPKKKAVKAA